MFSSDILLSYFNLFFFMTYPSKCFLTWKYLIFTIRNKKINSFCIFHLNKSSYLLNCFKFDFTHTHVSIQSISFTRAQILFIFNLLCTGQGTAFSVLELSLYERLRRYFPLRLKLAEDKKRTL